MVKQPQIILASASPRRAELLAQIGVHFQQQVADIDESIGDEQAEEAVVRLATEKALHIYKQEKDYPLPVLGADTIVVDGKAVLQKPDSAQSAMQMLQQLSGRTHRVMSAVALATAEGVEHALNISEVTFREISEAEQLAYWSSGEPADKAGGYAIQGMGAIFVEHLQGSYSGVMGLPLFETAQLLQRVGVKVL